MSDTFLGVPIIPASELRTGPSNQSWSLWLGDRSQRNHSSPGVEEYNACIDVLEFPMFSWHKTRYSVKSKWIKRYSLVPSATETTGLTMVVNQASCLLPKGPLRTWYLTHRKAWPRPAQSKQHLFWLFFYTVPLVALQPPSVLELGIPRVLNRGRMVDKGSDCNLRARGTSLYQKKKKVFLVLGQEHIYVTEHWTEQGGDRLYTQELRSNHQGAEEIPLCSLMFCWL